MSMGAGRFMRIEEAGVAIAGVRSKTFTINNEPIDVTTDDEDGIRRLLTNEAGTALIHSTKSIDAEFEGVTRSDELVRDIASGQNTVKELDLVFTSGAIIRGKFALVNMSLTGETADAQTFTGSLQSTGNWTWIDAP